jgi:hypothetical protein
LWLLQQDTVYQFIVQLFLNAQRVIIIIIIIMRFFVGFNMLGNARLRKGGEFEMLPFQFSA